MSHPYKNFKLRAMATSSAAVLGLAMSGFVAGAPAIADDDGAGDDRIVVTGSRIVRRDFEANSPIVTVEAEQFESQTGINVESYLNRLPQFNPALTPELGNFDVQPTAVNSVGIATLSLRGLGSNRNLVLVDGHRQTPINALMTVDVNSIPSALIQRVETITGGASAVYGADAVGGVVNFILKDDFEGLEVDAQYGVTEAGDGDQFRISALMGANFADGRGNVTMGMEHYSRSAAYQNNRDFYTETWQNPNIGTNEFFNVTHAYNSFLSPPSQAAVDVLFPDTDRNVCGIPGFFGPCAFTGFNFNTDGTVWVQGNGSYRFNGDLAGLESNVVNMYDGNSFTQGELIQGIKTNNEFNFVSSPQDRYSIYASGHIDITDNIEFFGRANFAESDTRTRLFPSPAITGWAVNIPYNPTLDSPIDPTAPVASQLETPNPSFIPTGDAAAHFPVPEELALLLNTRAVPDAPWLLWFIPDDWFDDRSTVDTNTVWQLETGLRGELPFRDWTWETFLSHGESTTYNVNNGNFSLQRYQAMIAGFDLFDGFGNRIVDETAHWDYGRGAVIQGNQESPNSGFGAATATCETGFYDTIFGRQAPSDDCRFAINAPLQGSTRHQQNIGEVNLQGALFDLPAGEVRTAVGLQYRENAVQYNPDILQSTASFIDQVVGVYPTAYMDASTYSEEGYAEALVPLIANVPGIQDFTLELGARYSNYEYSPDEWTYKALVDWSVNDSLRIRGGYNRATRSPNIGELFLGRQQFFGAGGAFGDPCGLRSNFPYGAGGALPDPILLPGEPETQVVNVNGAAGAASTLLICQALMGAGSGVYYAGDAGGAGGGGFAFQEQEGNPDLDSEEGDTWTIGAVFTSPSDNPWLANITATLDWYKLEVSNAIQQQSVDQARFACYGTTIVTSAAEAEAQASSAACQAVDRRESDGGELNTLVRYSNQAHIETSGVDLNVNWMADLQDIGLGLPGGLSANVQYSWLDYYKTRASDAAFDVETDWAGTLGPTLAGTNAGAYDYRLFTTLNYFVGPAGLSVRWRHLPEVDATQVAQERAIIANNIAVSNGAEGLVLSYTPNTTVAVKSYDIFDLSANWQVNDTVSLRFGVDNLLNIDPNRTGETRGYPSDVYTQADLANVCSAEEEALGCQDPTNFSLPNIQSGFGTGTSAGYYDNIGRRAFVGLKLTY